MARNTRHIITEEIKPENIDSPHAISKQQFGQKLAGMLIEKGWTQSELARRAGMGRDAISTYVRGACFPEPKNLHAIARALETSPTDLLPNSAMRAIDSAIPAFEIRQPVGQPTACWLRVNQLVPLETAVKIAGILADKKHGPTDTN